MTQDFSNRLSSARSQISTEQQVDAAAKAKVYNSGQEALDVIFRELKSLERKYDCQVTRPDGFALSVSVVAPIEYEKRLFRAEAPTKTVEFVIGLRPYEIKHGAEKGQIELGFSFYKIRTDLKTLPTPSQSDPESMTLGFRRSGVATVEDGLNYAARCIVEIFDGYAVRKR